MFQVTEVFCFNVIDMFHLEFIFVETFIYLITKSWNIITWLFLNFT